MSIISQNVHPKIAFIGWNPFQFAHVKNLAENLNWSCFIIEKRKNNLKKFDRKFFTGSAIPIIIWRRDKIKALDGIFDIIVCQTPFSQIEEIKKSKIVMIQYGYAKEVHNYGKWRAFAHLCLVYGNYAAKKISPLCPVKITGNPALEKWHDENYIKKCKQRLEPLLDPQKKTVLYAPTWGTLSTYNEYIDTILKLENRYNILLKIHHNTDFLEKKKRRKARRSNAIIFGASDSFIDLMSVSDLIISDYSGAIFDALYCKKPIILLHGDIEQKSGNKINKESIEYAKRDKIGPVVTSPEKLEKTIKNFFSGNIDYSAENRKIVADLYMDARGSVLRAAEEIKKAAMSDLTFTKEQSDLREINIAQYLKQKKRGTVLKKTKKNRSEQNKLQNHSSLCFKNLFYLSADSKRYLLRKILKNSAALAFTLKVLSPVFRKNTGYYLMAASAKRQNGKDDAALKILMTAQQYIPDSYRVHMALMSIYRDDNKIEAAYIHMLMAHLLNDKKGAVKKFIFESDNGLYEEGRKNLDKIYKLNKNFLLTQMVMINRVSVFYTDQSDRFNDLREELRQLNRQNAYLSGASLIRAIETAIDNRWVDDAFLFFKSRKIFSGKGKNTKKRVERLKTDFADYALLADAAWHNENCKTADDLTAFANGKSVKYLQAESLKLKTVEFFIPTVFFSKLSDEKPTYPAIRKIFLTMLSHLMTKPELAVIPRWQLNWRHCVPKSFGPVISYHTKNDNNAKQNHLHIQESPFAGYCSVDTQGFAGFSSIATDFKKIEDSLKGVSFDSMERNLQELDNLFIKNNISKYTQPEKNLTQLPPKYVFLPLQIQTDIVAPLAWINGIDLLNEVAEFFKNSSTKVVVKRHPYCGSISVQKNLERLEHNGLIIVSNDSIHRLIKGAEAVFLVNSGVGVEALIHKKAVVACGRCDYAYAATTVKTKQELQNILKSGPVANIEKTIKFLYFYKNEYLTDVNDAAAIRLKLDSWLNSFK
jgi:UDP-N-acetylglucosamine:LPS N-acetylglucosamine transferase